MGERWNTQDSVGMGIGIRRALASVLAGTDVPFEYLGSLEMGIEFLNEAKGGGALISGQSEGVDFFQGTFSPLCLANDVYITFVGPEMDQHQRQYDEVRGIFTKYVETLERVKSGEQVINTEGDSLKEIGRFFKVLCDLLLRPQGYLPCLEILDNSDLK